MRRREKQSLIESFRHAFDGIRYVVLSERNARIHVAAACAVIILSLWLRLAWLQWALILIAIGLVFAGEMLNTVVELTIDLVMPEQHELAKDAKDVAAGAILIFSLTAAGIGLLVLGPPLLDKLGSI
ncbi:MAG: diacylglycerol kinase family protein [Chloroflexi bacterium]|mgnify:CR=1 FL=1|nr:diacylglycerol kinase family protein [Chloroflexota bacterium]